MAIIVDGVWIDKNDAKGGTELMIDRLLSNVPTEFLEGTQIFVSQFDPTAIDKSKKQVLYLHDLDSDPMVAHLLQSKDHWDAIVFVSHWQRQQFHNRFNLSWDKTFVIYNAIKPLEFTKKKDGPLKLIYTSVPNRGLELLYPVFDELTKHFDVELDVFSSFALYNRQQMDEHFKQLFDALNAHPKINYHGFKSNDEVRSALENSDIFAYPSINRPETSSLCLIEAMSAGLTCVNSSLGALPETSKALTWQYDYTDNVNNHLNRFFSALYRVCSLYNTSGVEFMRTNGHYQKSIVDHTHSINMFTQAWSKLLAQLRT